MEKKRLGRGLDALLGGDVTEMTGEATLAQIDHNPQQPRKNFDPDELASLTASVKTHGILQPLVVRQKGERYQLIAGERRLRAAQEIGLKSVPIHVVDLNDQEAFEAALIENIQRTDLNPIEKAQGFVDYVRQFNVNQDQLAQRLGLARSTVSNLIGLLDLPQEVKEGIRLNQITEGHAKLLKGIKPRDRQVAIFKQIVAMGLSVKEAEALTRDLRVMADPEPAPPPTVETPKKTAHVMGLEDELRKRLATPVEIRLRGKERGQIVLRFETNDDFERLLEVLRK
jgi:ParB family chromosome partitioning protein